MRADTAAGGVFAAMADSRPAIIRAGVGAGRAGTGRAGTGRVGAGRAGTGAQDVDLIPAARPMFMRPDITCHGVHRHPLRVAMPDGEDFRRPSRLLPVGEMRVVRMRRAVRRQADDAGGVGRRVLPVVTIAAVAKRRPQRGAGDMKPTTEMMPAWRRHIAGEDGAPADQPVPIDHRAVDGRRRPARQNGAVTQIDMPVDGRDIQQPALAAGIDIRRAGDFGCGAVGPFLKIDLPQLPAARGDKNGVGCCLLYTSDAADE